MVSESPQLASPAGGPSHVRWQKGRACRNGWAREKSGPGASTSGAIVRALLVWTAPRQTQLSPFSGQ